MTLIMCAVSWVILIQYISSDNIHGYPSTTKPNEGSLTVIKSLQLFSDTSRNLQLQHHGSYEENDGPYPYLEPGD